MALTFRVRIAWATDPFSGSPTWTDVSSFVHIKEHSIDMQRGAQYLDDSVQASTLSFTVNNADGRFTPGYTGGAYYPNVVRGKRVRVDASVDGTNYFNRFDGFIDTLPVTWSAGGLTAPCTITAVDRTDQLSRQLLPYNIVTTYYLLDAPTDYWTLGDPDGTINPVNLTGTTLLAADTHVYSANQSITWGSGTGVSTDGLTAVEVVDTALVATGSPQYNCFGASFSAEGFIRLDGALPTDVFNIVEFFGVDQVTGAADGFTLGVTQDIVSGHAVAAGLWTGSAIGIGGVTILNDGNTHHVACTFDGTTLKLFVDGSLEGSTAPGGFTNPPLFCRISAVATSRVIDTTPPTATFDHVAAYQTVLSATDIALHAKAGLTGFSGETSAARFTRIAGFAGITPTVTGTPGTQSMGPLSGVQGQSILTLLQAVQNTENGAMFVQTDGTLRLVPRTALYNLAAAQTLAAGQYGTDLTFLVDGTRIINDAVGTGLSGDPQEVTNPTSITANGTITKTQDINSTSDIEVLSWAQWKVGIDYTVPRVNQVSLDLLTHQSLCTTAWAVDIGNRLDLSGLPTGAPASSVKLQIDGYAESYSLNAYAITFNTNSYQTGSMFTFDDATLGKFDGPGLLAY